MLLKIWELMLLEDTKIDNVELMGDAEDVNLIKKHLMNIK